MNHLFEAGEQRERLAIIRWLYGHAREVVGAMGLHEGWWCGINLRRRDVFADDTDGDVDLVAGPVHYTFDADELQRRIDDVRARQPFAAEQVAHYQAAAVEGRVSWPPPLDVVVACEVKASYFADGRWKITHTGERRRLLGQLDYLAERGINSVSFLHLGATKPNQENDIRTLSLELDRAQAIFPIVFDADERPEYGLLRGMMGAVQTDIEARSGLHQTQVVRLAHLRAARMDPWRHALRDRLASLPRPICRAVFVLGCENCKAWRLAYTTDQVPACACGTPA